MQSNRVPDELVNLRDRIDVIDEQLLALLARRFEVTERVGRVKAEYNLNSIDAGREQEKLIRLEELAKELSLNPDFVLTLFQMIFAEVVKNHRSIRKDP